MEYKIVGIFEVATENLTSSASSAEPDIPENFIFTDTASYQMWYKFFTGGNELAGYTGGVTFFVENPMELDEIVNNLAGISGYDAQAYKLTRNNTAYDHSAIPLERMSGLITIFIFVIILMSMAILSLILIMWMKDRKYEIGIFMSLGLKKSNIVLQHLAENLVIAVLAFLLAWGLSGLAASQIGGMLLDTVVENTGIAEQKTSDYSMYTDPIALEDVDTGGALIGQRRGVGVFYGIQHRRTDRDRVHNVIVRSGAQNEAERCFFFAELDCYKKGVFKMSVLELQKVSFAYYKNKMILDEIDMQFERGKMYVIIGPSGCGKTTLLSLIGGLDSPRSGKILFEGEDIGAEKLEEHRRNHVSFVFQKLQSDRLHDAAGECAAHSAAGAA